jgi:hypothetical protein
VSGIVLAIDATWDGKYVDFDTEGVQILLDDGGDALKVSVDAPFHGDPAPAAPPGPTDGLWDHEVVEVFIAGFGAGYTEIELGPHGHHLVLRLRGVRDVIARCIPIAYSAKVRGDRWEGEALIPHALLPPGPHRVNAYAIHGVGAQRRYLALAEVPGDKPDFHQPHRFAAIDLPGLP